MFRRLPLFLLTAIAVSACHRGDVVSKRYDRAPVILISIDTLRADHVHAYNSDSGPTPNLDALAADSILFRNAYSQVPLTLPSHASLLSGRLPADINMRDNIGYRFSSPNHDSMPEEFAAAGYATAGAISAYVLRGDTGLKSIFQTYDDAIPFTAGMPMGELQRPGEKTFAAADAWLTAHEQKPFFLFVHVYEPHAPYTPPAPYPQSYDGEVAYTDAIVGKFLDGLKARGLYDRSVVVLLSDHGEGLGDHGESEHGIFLYREAIHVPLMMKLPHGDNRGSVREQPAGLIDVFPTLAALTGVRTPAGLPGRSLLGALPADRAVFSESEYARLHFGWSDLRSLVDADHHYIDAPRPELYSVAKDPGERNNLAAEDRRTVGRFRTAIAQFAKPLTAPAPVSEEERSKLASLGYLGSTASTPSGPLPDPKDRLSDLDDYQRALDALRAGDSKSGIALLESIVSRNPDFSDAALQLADMYTANGRSREALALYHKLLAKNPALSEQVVVGVAAAHLDLGEYDLARANAELARHSNPGAAEMLLARIDLTAGNARSAEAHAKTAATFAAYRVPAVILATDAMIKQRDRAKDVLALIDEQQRLGDAAGFGIQRARALLQLGRNDDAVAALRAEITAYPTEADAYGELAAVYLLQNRDGEAISLFEHLVDVTHSPAACLLAAQTFDHFGRGAIAERWRAAAARVNP